MGHLTISCSFLSSQGDYNCTLYVSTDLCTHQNHRLTLSDRVGVLFQANHHNCKVQVGSETIT